MLKIKANNTEERRIIVSSLVESGYKVSLFYHVKNGLRPTSLHPYDLGIPDAINNLFDEMTTDVYIVAEEVNMSESCRTEN